MIYEGKIQLLMLFLRLTLCKEHSIKSLETDNTSRKGAYVIQDLFHDSPYKTYSDEDVKNKKTTAKTETPTTEAPTTEAQATEAPTTEGTTPEITHQPEFFPESWKCPEKLQYLEDEYNTPFCYVLTAPQPFPPLCPYPNYLPYNYNEYTKNHFDNETFWAKASRNVTNGLGPFIWFETENHGSIVDYYYSTVLDKNIIAKACMVFKEGVLNPESCSRQYPALCLYIYNSFNIDKYCTKHNIHYYTCLSDGIDIENSKCYCQKRLETRGLSRNSFCPKLAEPLRPFQSHLLRTQLTGTCWFGMHRSQQREYLWSSTNTTVSYDYFSPDANRFNPYGAMVSSDLPKYSKGWTMEGDNTLDCAICEIDNNYSKHVSLKLRYNYSSTYIDVRVTNPIEISDFFGKNYSIFCFSGGNKTHTRDTILPGVEDMPNNDKHIVLTLSIQEIYPNYFWCEAFQHPNFSLVRSNKLLVYDTKFVHGREYSSIVHVRGHAYPDPFADDIIEKVCVYIESYTYRTVQTVRPIKVLELDEEFGTMNLLVHITAKLNNLTALEEHANISSALEVISEKSAILNVTYFESSEFCFESTTTSGNTTLHWPETHVGVTTIPIELCLQENLSPVTRTCKGDFIQGGFWSDPTGECAPNSTYPEKTVTLYMLLHADLPASVITENLSNITQNDTNVLTVEVYLISQILGKLVQFEDEINVTETAVTLSNAMGYDEEVVRHSQNILNSTDIILYNFDRILEKTAMSQNKQLIVQSPKVFTQVLNLRLTNISGISFRRNKNELTDSFDSYSFDPIYKHTSINDLLNSHIEGAAFIPNGLLEEIDVIVPPSIPVMLIISVFYNDAFFSNGSRYSDSRIISVIMPELYYAFETPIPVIFTPLSNNSQNGYCGCWKYGRNDLLETIKGSWSQETLSQGNPNAGSSNKICEFPHMTHFALLIIGSKANTDFKDDETPLSILTAIGCIMSLLGVLAIFITAILSENWRSQPGNIIMIHFAFAIAMQIVFLFIADNIKNDETWCMIAGIALHYSVISEFCWMLIIGYLQYIRFVAVFNTQRENILIKSCLIGWVLPLLPVVVLVAISPKVYTKNSFGVCYPSGNYFYFAILLPVAITVAINLFVFAKILFNVCHNNSDVNRSKKHDGRLEVLLAVLLYFLLGITWIFGLCANVGGVIFAYLFCLTATLQGFVIFIFFVVMNSQVKLVWLKYCSAVCGKQKKFH